MNKSIPRIALAGLVLLAISTLFILLGRQDLDTNPSATNYAPPGTSIFAELLRRQGYKVRVDNSVRPRPGKDELLIVLDNGVSLSEDLRRAMRRHLESGGKIFRGEMPLDYFEATKQLQPVEIESLYEETDRLRIHCETDGGEPLSWENDWSTIFVGSADNGMVASAGIYKTGEGVTVNDAVGITNRFIDQADNARFYVGLVKGLASAGATVTFLDAAAGQGRPLGLLETVGNWVRYSWYQTLFLFVVVVYTLGRRFGLGVVERPVQGGQRDLVDAMAGIYRRGRAAQAALQAVVKDADRRIRQLAKVSLDAPAELRNERLDTELVSAFQAAERASMDSSLPESEALAQARRLQAEIGSRQRPTVGRRRKRH